MKSQLEVLKISNGQNFSFTERVLAHDLDFSC